LKAAKPRARWNSDVQPLRIRIADGFGIGRKRNSCLPEGNIFVTHDNKHFVITPVNQKRTVVYSGNKRPKNVNRQRVDRKVTSKENMIIFIVTDNC